MSEGRFQFSTPDRRRMWLGLALTMSQAAVLTGVSERQIQHWMDRGYLPGALEAGRKVNGDNLDMILLIRQAREAGIPLRRAVRMANEYLMHEASTLVDTEVAPAALRDLGEQLTTLRDGIDAVSVLLRRIAPPDASREGPILTEAWRNRVSSQGKEK